MTKQELESRLKVLEAEKQKAIAHANAISGQIREVSFWLSSLEKENKRELKSVEASL